MTQDHVARIKLFQVRATKDLAFPMLSVIAPCSCRKVLESILLLHSRACNTWKSDLLPNCVHYIACLLAKAQRSPVANTSWDISGSIALVSPPSLGLSNIFLFLWRRNWLHDRLHRQGQEELSHSVYRGYKHIPTTWTRCQDAPIWRNDRPKVWWHGEMR